MQESQVNTAITASGVAKSLVLAGYLLYTSSRESNNTSAHACFMQDHVT